MLPTIQLAREPAFTLGQIEVRPATREVVCEGRREPLEPRVMQVLVALARRAGEVVSRNDLIESCWAGRIVGDDAVNRSIGQLRALARRFEAFEIETIPRVGYRLTARQEASAAAAPEGVVLAVLPFDNLSTEAELAYFSDGVSEEILHTVARRTDLKVIGRSSSFAFRGPAKAARNVAQELNATHVLDGSVRRNADRVRISVELVECAGQTAVWADRFDRDMSDVLKLQDEIAVAVARALKAELADAAEEAQVNPEAYDLFLRARQTELSRAVPLLEKTVSLAPQFVSAWAELAHLRAVANRGISLDLDARSVSRQAVLAAAEQALRLDPNCGLAQVALAQLRPWGDYAGRAASLRTALSSGAATTEIATEMAWFLNEIGHAEEAATYAAQARDLDPWHPGAVNVYAQSLAFSGRYEDALRIYADGDVRWPEVFHFTIGALYLAMMAGDWAAFDRLQGRVAAASGANRHAARILAASAMIRDPTPARRERILTVLREQVRDSGAVQLSTLSLAHRMGLADEAFDFVGRSSFDHLRLDDGPAPAGEMSPGIIFNRSARTPMMMDPRFVTLCQKLGLCRYWAETDRWPDCAKITPYDFKAAARLGLASA